MMIGVPVVAKDFGSFSDRAELSARGHGAVIFQLFTSRRGMAPAMRAFIDYVAKQLPPRLEAFN
jgi:hypothetical protein